MIERLTADDRHKKANPKNYSQSVSRLLCNLFFFPSHAVWLEACLECLARGRGGLLITSRLPASSRPLDYRLLLLLLSVPLLSRITRCMYSSAALRFLQMHSADSNCVRGQISSLLPRYHHTLVSVVSGRIKSCELWSIYCVTKALIPLRERRYNHTDIRSHCFVRRFHTGVLFPV